MFNIQFNKVMIKKEYIQPTVKEIKVTLPAVLAAASLHDDTTGVSLTNDESEDFTDPDEMD